MKKLLFLISLFLGQMAWASLHIDVVGAQSEPMPIALPAFGGGTPEQEKAGRQITEVVISDLERTGLFRIIDKEAYIQELKGINDEPKFSDWQALGAHALVHGEITGGQEGEPFKASFRLWDVFARHQMEAKALTTDSNAWRTVAHMIADVLYERLTGEKGYFNSVIVFISESGNQKNRKKRLAIMDSDGANLRYLTDGSYRVLTPRFSPTMAEVTYFSYKDGRPRVYNVDVRTGISKLVGDFPGMTFAPRFSPDGKKLLLTMAQYGNSEIYLYDLATGKKKQLTDHPAIDTSPSFSPDGKKIVFNSDRSGSQQLYVMNADGSGVERISFGDDGGYATPVWSPRGDYIAFTKIQRGADENHKFHIGIMRPDGSGQRLIANGFLVEGPTWAPNGRVLMFFRRNPYDKRGNGGKSKIYTIDITGHNEQMIETPQDASDPAWSPNLTGL